MPPRGTEADAKAERILPALFLKMFGDPATNPKGWEVVKLAQFADVQGGLQLTSKRAGNPLEIPYLRVANVHRNRLDVSEIKTLPVTPSELSRARLYSGDVLVVEGHGNPAEIGRCAIWDGSIDPCLHQNHLIRVRVNPVHASPQFVNSFLNSRSGRQHLISCGKTTSGLNTISVSNVKQVKMLLPPIALQQEYASAESSHNATSCHRARRTKHLERLWRMVMSRAFSGHLTASWRAAHMKELLQEMELQTRALSKATPAEATA